MSFQQSAIVRGIVRAASGSEAVMRCASRSCRPFCDPDVCDRLGHSGRRSPPGGCDGRRDAALVGRGRVQRSLPPDEFVAFHEPGSTFRTETRVVTTDSGARAKFRRYWAFASPGIIVIRWAFLGVVKSQAERRQRTGAVSVTPAR